MHSQFRPIQPDFAFPIYGFEMQEHTSYTPVWRNAELAPIPQPLPLGNQQLLCARQQGFPRERNSDTALVSAKVCLSPEADAKIPRPLDAQPIRSLHRRTRIFRMRNLGLNVLAPSSY